MNIKKYQLFTKPVYFRFLLIFIVLLPFFTSIIYFYSPIKQNVLIPNSSIFSILIASQIAFIIPFLINYYKIFKIEVYFIFIILLFLIAIVFLIKSNGRAGWVGLLGSVLYIYFSIQKLKPSLKKILIFLLIICSSASCLSFFYKVDSSMGRLFIYKISMKIFLDNPVLGVGQGKFKANYNNYQAAYFAKNNINNKEALLADNTFYAFNDYLQFLIEHGILGFSILVFLIYAFLQYFKKIKFHDFQKVCISSITSSIVVILISALFSYPFQVPIISIHFSVCVTLILLELSKAKFYTGYKFLLSRAIIFFIFFMLFTYFVGLISYKYKVKESEDLKKSGYKNEAVKLYYNLKESYFNNGTELFLLAQELYHKNNLKESKEILNLTKEKIVSTDIYKLSAEIEFELKNYKQAENDLKKVIYMVPNRMKPRMNLVDFYLDQKDTTSASYWAESIRNMPVKIISTTTIGIQKRAKEIFKK